MPAKFKKIMAKFFLRTSQPKGTASLYVRVNRPTLGIQWMVCTKIDVDIECWNKAQKTAKALAQYYATESGKRVQEMTEKVAGIIDDLFINGSLTSNADKEILDNAISGIVNCKGIKALEEAELRKRDEAEKRLCVVWNYYEYFIEGISDGTLRKGRDNEKYRKNSLSVWKTFGKHLRGYLDYKKMQEITFDGINRAFADGFILYLEGKGLMPVTINQQVICFRRLCNAAAIDEKNTNLISVKVWRERNVNDKDKRAEVALSDDEINALYGMRLEGLCEQVRDVWMLGYLSAQRVSDYSRLGRDNFKVTPNGLSVIVLQQKKTGNDVIIPILDERVKELCEKYNYDFPELTRDTINQYIKRVMKELSLTVASLREWSRTQLCLKERNKEQSYISMCKRVECGEELHG